MGRLLKHGPTQQIIFTLLSSVSSIKPACRDSRQPNKLSIRSQLPYFYNYKENRMPLHARLMHGSSLRGSSKRYLIVRTGSSGIEGGEENEELCYMEQNLEEFLNVVMTNCRTMLLSRDCIST